MKKHLLPTVILTLLLASCAAPSAPSETNNPSAEQTESYPAVTEPAISSDTEAPTTDAPVLLPPEPSGEQFAPLKDGIYNYCPSVIRMEDGTQYLYYCTNRESYNITDSIACRRGERQADGTYQWGEECIVLSPSENGWDAHHVCDPSVIAGSFSYQGKNYRYLMAYLGCTSYDNQENKLGIAVSDSPTGPFERIGTKPLIDFAKDPSSSAFQWGVGQPSLVNYNREADILLFYTRGDKAGTRTLVERYDFSDLDSPQRKSSAILSVSGLKNLSGKQDILNNADFVYDAENRIFYCASDCHPNPTDEPNYISSHFRIGSFAEPANFRVFVWKELAVVGENLTGAPRNHNVGLARDEYGHLPADGYLTVYYTVSKTGSSSLWSYRILDYYYPLS